MRGSRATSPLYGHTEIYPGRTDRERQAALGGHRGAGPPDPAAVAAAGRRGRGGRQRGGTPPRHPTGRQGITCVRRPSPRGLLSWAAPGRPKGGRWGWHGELASRAGAVAVDCYGPARKSRAVAVLLPFFRPRTGSCLAVAVFSDTDRLERAGPWPFILSGYTLSPWRKALNEEQAVLGPGGDLRSVTW